MAEDESNSSPSSSLRAEDTISETSAENEVESLLSAQAVEEERKTRDVELTAGILRVKLPSGNTQFLLWTCINTLATIAIVSALRQNGLKSTNEA